MTAESLETQLARMEGTVTAELRAINRTLGDMQTTTMSNHADHETRIRLLETNSSQLSGKLAIVASVLALISTGVLTVVVGSFQGWIS